MGNVTLSLSKRAWHDVLDKLGRDARFDKLSVTKGQRDIIR